MLSGTELLSGILDGGLPIENLEQMDLPGTIPRLPKGTLHKPDALCPTTA